MRWCPWRIGPRVAVLVGIRGDNLVRRLKIALLDQVSWSLGKAVKRRANRIVVNYSGSGNLEPLLARQKMLLGIDWVQSAVGSLPKLTFASLIPVSHDPQSVYFTSQSKGTKTSSITTGSCRFCRAFS